MIQLENVSKIFNKGKEAIHALSGINLSIPAGQIFGVIGHSGAGKSTLIRMVNLLERPSSGSIIVNEQNLTTLSGKKLTHARRQIGMIFQHFNLLSSRTVFENIALPLELEGISSAEKTARITKLLELVGLSDKTHAYPSELSGGQKQRVAIARALANNPQVLLCDEATSALDPETTRSILSLLKEINQQFNLTILLITHEMEVVKQICHHVAVISEGKLIEQAPVSELFSNPQTDVARNFIHSSLNLTIPDDYQARLSSISSEDKCPLIKLEFTGQSVDAPLLSQVTHLFNVNTNIISAQMDCVGGVKFGFLLTEVQGNTNDIEKAIQFLIQHHVKVEVLGYV